VLKVVPMLNIHTVIIKEIYLKYQSHTKKTSIYKSTV
jgi:hypothetical protein